MRLRARWRALCSCQRSRNSTRDAKNVEELEPPRNLQENTTLLLHRRRTTARNVRRRAKSNRKHRKTPQFLLIETISKAFDSFAHPDVIPVVRAGHAHVAELFHGPTGSFKDVALSVYGKIVENHLETTRRRVTILNSTTGDTGSAAIRSVLGGTRVRIVVMYPAGKISDIQELQMATVDAPNVKVFRVDGTSDEIDGVVKTLFCDEEFGREQSLGSFSSINVGRLVCQIAHFFYIYLKTCVDVGDEVLVAIPTGGGGHIVTGTIATRMGLPLKFLLATNENDTATRFVSK